MNPEKQVILLFFSPHVALACAVITTREGNIGNTLLKRTRVKEFLPCTKKTNKHAHTKSPSALQNPRTSLSCLTTILICTLLHVTLTRSHCFGCVTLTVTEYDQANKALVTQVKMTIPRLNGSGSWKVYTGCSTESELLVWGQTSFQSVAHFQALASLS